MMGKDDDGERKKRERGVKNVKGRGGQAEMMKCNKERGKERQNFFKKSGRREKQTRKGGERKGGGREGWGREDGRKNERRNSSNGEGKES